MMDTQDYRFFVAPYLLYEAPLRGWFMRDVTQFDGQATQQFGYDANWGLIRNSVGPGQQLNFSVVNPNMILSKSLDYFNAQAGVRTELYSNVTYWLAKGFVNNTSGQSYQNSCPYSPTQPCGPAGYYQGNDRRELLFGTNVDCVRDDTGGSPKNVAGGFSVDGYGIRGHAGYTPGHPHVGGALPTTCRNDPHSVAYMTWLLLNGNRALAQRLFDDMMGNFTATPHTGAGGSTGGYFSSYYDAGACASTGAVASFVMIARAAGFWQESAQALAVTQEAANQIWGDQLQNGGISASESSCSRFVGNATGSAEAGGYALVSIDPRLPYWFGTLTGLNASYNINTSNGALFSLFFLCVVLGGVYVASRTISSCHGCVPLRKTGRGRGVHDSKSRDSSFRA